MIPPIFVDCLRSNPITSSKNFLESLEGTDNGFTSSIVVAELSVGAYLSQKKDALDKTLKIISTTSVIDLDKEIALLGGQIYSNIDHFNKIKNLRVVTPDDLNY